MIESPSTGAGRTIYNERIAQPVTQRAASRGWQPVDGFETARIA